MVHTVTVAVGAVACVSPRLYAGLVTMWSNVLLLVS